MTDAFARSAVVHTLGLTLLHFLWQGLVIGLVTALGLRLMRRHSATARYAVACAGLVAMLAAPLVTWRWLTVSAVPADMVRAPVVASALLTGTPAPPQMAPSGTWTIAGLDTLMRFVVIGWMTGVVLLTLRLARVWVAVEQLRRRTLRPLPAVWKARVGVLAARVGIARDLRTAESWVLDVPTVVGWLRPVIVVPTSALMGLAPSQLEAILAHELAHIRRHDYLVNLVQRVVETWLFYHPAVWWVSRQITLERELCCDDIAVGVCGDRVAYAHALASLEQLRPAMPAVALAATGGSLVVRIRRLLNGTPPRADRSPVWTAVALGLTLGALFVASDRVTRAETPPVTRPSVRTDIQLPKPAAPPEAQGAAGERPAIVAHASLAENAQPQAQLPPPRTTSALPATPPPSPPPAAIAALEALVAGPLFQRETTLSAQASRAAKSANVGPNVIRAGDILGVSVLQDVSLLDDVVVLPEGDVRLPLVNSVRAAGLTLEQFCAEVASKFSLGTQHILVMLKQSHTPRVVVIGQVRRPGEYPLSDKLTLPQLVGQAGGLTDSADREVVVVRASKVAGGTGPKSDRITMIHFADVQNGASSVELLSGDVVYFN